MSRLAGQFIWDGGVCLPVVCESVVHAVEDDEQVPGLHGGEERGSPGVERISGLEEGDGGQIDGAQLPQAAACSLCTHTHTHTHTQSEKGEWGCFIQLTPCVLRVRSS